MSESVTLFVLFIILLTLQEGTSKFASLENCAKEHQKRTHKRLQLQKEMVRQRLAKKSFGEKKKCQTNQSARVIIIRYIGAL